VIKEIKELLLPKKLASIEAKWKPLNDERESALDELTLAKKSYDFVDRVYVEQLCKRVCCIESKFTGVVIGIHNNVTYKICDTDGNQHRYISNLEMTRK